MILRTFQNCVYLRLLRTLVCMYVVSLNLERVRTVRAFLFSFHTKSECHRKSLKYQRNTHGKIGFKVLTCICCNLKKSGQFHICLLNTSLISCFVPFTRNLPRTWLLRSDILTLLFRPLPQCCTSLLIRTSLILWGMPSPY